MQTQLLTWQISIQRVKPTPAELATLYDRLAHHWSAKIRRLGFDRAYRQWLTDLYPQLFTATPMLNRAESKGIPVLDCGVGTGALTLALHQITPLPLQLHGVDVAPKMVAEARHRLAEAGASLQAKVHDICALPYADHSFHLVMNAHTLEHLAEPQVGLREMVRVLQPGGLLLLIVTRPGLLGRLLDARWGLCLITPTELQQWLQAAGLSEVQFHPLGGPHWCRWLSFSCTARKVAG